MNDSATTRNVRLPKTKPHVLSSETSGSGFKQWETKRAIQFSKYVKQISKAQRADLDVLLFAVHEICKLISDQIPDEVTKLPRGYGIVYAYGDRVLERDGALFSSVGRNLATREQIQQLYEDLRSGWLRECDEAAE